MTTLESFRLRDPKDAIFADTYWVDVDVALNGIIRHQLPSPIKLGRHQPLSFPDTFVLEGVGAVGFAPNESIGADKNQFAVRIRRYAEAGAVPSELEPPDACQVTWERRGDHTWRSTIYLSNFILRQIVEFFVTKRIDNIRLSIQVSKWESEPTMSADPSRLMWSGSGFQSDDRTRCPLLSVMTSKGRIYPPMTESSEPAAADG
jgi:hypothetical protein